MCLPFIILLQDCRGEILINVAAVAEDLLQLEGAAAYNLVVDLDVNTIGADSKCAGA